MGNAMFLIPTPQVLQNLHTDAFWDANDVLLFKKVRKELRQLTRFWDESNGKQKRIVTRLTDSVVDGRRPFRWMPLMTLRLIGPR